MGPGKNITILHALPASGVQFEGGESICGKAAPIPWTGQLESRGNLTIRVERLAYFQLPFHPVSTREYAFPDIEPTIHKVEIGPNSGNVLARLAFLSLESPGR